MSCTTNILKQRLLEKLASGQNDIGIMTYKYQSYYDALVTAINNFLASGETPTSTTSLNVILDSATVEDYCDTSNLLRDTSLFAADICGPAIGLNMSSDVSSLPYDISAMMGTAANTMLSTAFFNSLGVVETAISRTMKSLQDAYTSLGISTFVVNLDLLINCYITYFGETVYITNLMGLLTAFCTNFNLTDAGEMAINTMLSALSLPVQAISNVINIINTLTGLLTSLLSTINSISEVSRFLPDPFVPYTLI